MKIRVALRIRGRLQRVRREGDRGFLALEAVIIIPVAIILTMLVVQYVMLWHARNVAEAAAQNGLRAARAYQASAAQGQASASDYLHNVAGGMLTNTHVDANRSATTVTVHVSAHVKSVIPFGHFTVAEHAIGPVERFTG
ncbi:MAG TPA: TadE/TadG family type IV pilus assembly protein [Jatrophihabitantaceae bacterium]|jgi:Flp pilus assembly protein TadG